MAAEKVEDGERILSEDEHNTMMKIAKFKQNIVNAIDKLNKDEVEYRKDIDKQSDFIINAIKERKQKLTAKLDEVVKDKKAKLTKQLKELKKDEIAIKECHSKCKEYDDFSFDASANIIFNIDVDDILSAVMSYGNIQNPDKPSPEASPKNKSVKQVSVSTLSKQEDIKVDVKDDNKYDDDHKINEADQPQQPFAEFPSISNLSKYVASIMSDDIQKQIKGTMAIRKLLSIERDPPIRRVINAGIIPKIIGFMATNSEEQQDVNQQSWHRLQFEAAWVVTNIASIASGKYTRFISQHGAIEGFVNLFRAFHSTNPTIADQALWGLGNIAADGKHLRDRIVKTGILNDLANNLSILESELQRNAVWTISNIFRYNDPLELTEISALLPVLCSVLRECKDPYIERECLWAFNYLSSNQYEGIISYSVQNTSIISDCMNLLRREAAKYVAGLNQMKVKDKKQASLKMNQEIYRPCLRFIGNILTESNDMTQAVLDAGYLDIIEPWTEHFLPAQRKEIMWTFSNILAGSSQQIQTFLSKPNLVRLVMDSGKYAKFQVKIEAVWCICNALSEALSEQKMFLAENGAIEVLCGILRPVNSLTDIQLQIVIEGMEEFLSVYGGNGFNPYADIMEEYQGLDSLEERQCAENVGEEACSMIADLIEKYWQCDDDKYGEGSNE